MRIRTRVTERVNALTEDQLASQGPACIVAIAGSMLGVRVDLSHATLHIGRSSEAGLSIPHPSVSRNHCRILREETSLADQATRQTSLADQATRQTSLADQATRQTSLADQATRQTCFWIEDLGSTNKTFVNGAVVQKAKLNDGDRVKIGEHVFKFFDAGSVEADYQKQLVELAIVDELTGLSNRRHFVAHLGFEIAEAQRAQVSPVRRHDEQLPLQLVIADIDDFKAVNDQHGHLDGDIVLRGFARLLLDNLPPLAIAGRIGGEEFGIVIPESSLEDALHFAELIRKKFAAMTHTLGRANIQVSASFGVAQFTPEMTEPAHLMRAADKKLYDAKSAGRNKVAS
jgi:diguanylate cyclase (GGDEF)-like protein